ncbi:MAG: hypothetical protein QOH21_1882 [Acidobacteriota bacterium]|nr:hypothetical protein [Acidobacteriota bacterium]
MQRILVTGATGTIGREVVAQLVAERAAGSNTVVVRGMTRNPEGTELPGNVEVVRGDFTDPDRLEPALRDVDVLFLLWTAPAEAVRAAVERIARHVPRLVFLSSPHQTPHPFFQQPNRMAAMHAEIERVIQVSGMEWTFVRPGIFAANTIPWWGKQIREGSIVRWPYGDAATAPIHESDVAAVAVRALTDDRQRGRDYVITGPDSLTQREQVLTIGAALGRSLTFEEIAPEDMHTVLPAPPAVLDMLRNAWAAALGQPAYVTSSVADVTHRPARTFRQWATDHVAQFRS